MIYTVTVTDQYGRVETCRQTSSYLLIHEQDGEFVVSGNISPELLLKLAGPALGEKMAGIFSGLPFRKH